MLSIDLVTRCLDIWTTSPWPYAKLPFSQWLFNMIQMSVYIKFHWDVNFAAQCLESFIFPVIWPVSFFCLQQLCNWLNFPLHGFPRNPKPTWKSTVATVSSLIARAYVLQVLCFIRSCVSSTIFVFTDPKSLLPLSSSSSLQFSLPAASNLWWWRRVYINNTQTTKILIFLGSHLCVDSKCAEYILWYQSPRHCSHLSVASPAGSPDTNIYWGISQARWIMACEDLGDKTKDPSYVLAITRAASTSVGDRKEGGTEGGIFKCGMEQGGRGVPTPCDDLTAVPRLGCHSPGWPWATVPVPTSAYTWSLASLHVNSPLSTES